MRKSRTIEQPYLECDGCQYLMSEDDPRIEVTVPFDFPWKELQSDPIAMLTFHFHALGQRHDCFRYWAHDPHNMKRSLKEHGLDDNQIDDFMSLMLYRQQNGFGPGVARAKEKV